MSTPDREVTVYNQAAADVPVSKGMGGFTQGLSAIAGKPNLDKPKDKFVNPINPPCYRDDYRPDHPITQATMNRIHDLRMVFVVDLMTTWTYNHSNNEPPGANGWATYENVIHNAVDYMLSLDNASTDNVYFEIWNEPNSHLDAGVPIGKGFGHTTIHILLKNILWTRGNMLMIR
jgi:hypothetical protein